MEPALLALLEQPHPEDQSLLVLLAQLAVPPAVPATMELSHVNQALLTSS